MTIDGQMLLRMLEPAVRPDGVAGRATGAPPPSTPIEGRAFDELLTEARRIGTDDLLEQNQATQTRPADALGGLAQVDRIENRSLLRVVARASANASAGRTQ
jgi:hypothetical protein